MQSTLFFLTNSLCGDGSSVCVLIKIFGYDKAHYIQHTYNTGKTKERTGFEHSFKRIQKMVEINVYQVFFLLHFPLFTNVSRA